MSVPLCVSAYIQTFYNIFHAFINALIQGPRATECRALLNEVVILLTRVRSAVYGDMQDI